MDAIADYAFHLFRFVFRVKFFFTIKYKFLIKRHTHTPPMLQLIKLPNVEPNLAVPPSQQIVFMALHDCITVRQVEQDLAAERGRERHKKTKTYIE